MRLLLDTTYLLPAIGLSVKGLSDDFAIEVIGRGHEVAISEITLFELSTMGAKQIGLGALRSASGP